MITNDERLVTQRGQAEVDEPTVTGDSRMLWGWLVVIGVLLCFSPVALLGAGLIIAFGLLWLCAPGVEALERETIQDTRETGNGVGKFIQTVVLMVFLGALATGVAVAAMLAIMVGA